MKAKPEKTMIVVVDKLGYVVPASIVQSLRRTFNTKFARAKGEPMVWARAFVRDRLHGRVSYQHDNPAYDVPPFARQHFIADVLAERLVRKWLRDGYLEVVTRGRYRRASR